MGLSTVTCHVFCSAARRQEHQRYTNDGSIRQHERLCTALPLVNMVTSRVSFPGQDEVPLTVLKRTTQIKSIFIIIRHQLPQLTTSKG